MNTSLALPPGAVSPAEFTPQDIVAIRSTVQHHVTVISGSIPKDIDKAYILRQTAANITIVRASTDIGKTLDYNKTMQSP